MAEQKRDRYQRYLLPDPNTGEERAWTRATTWAKTVLDTYGLEKWKMRMVAKGIAQRPDLLALAAALPLTDKRGLDRLAEDAKEHAGASSGSNIGTALHAFTEQVDRGETPDVPEPWKKDVNAYRKALLVSGIRIVPEYVERVVVCTELGVAGTLDRIVSLGDPLYIGDVKTGADLSYSWTEIAIQLAIYARADFMWDGEQYEPMPAVDQDRAFVFHLPAGQGKCLIYTVDILSGWMAANLSDLVRSWRARKDLAQLWVPQLELLV